MYIFNIPTIKYSLKIYFISVSAKESLSFSSKNTDMEVFQHAKKRHSLNYIYHHALV